MSFNRSTARRWSKRSPNRLKNLDRQITILLEINVAGEEQKAGMPIGDAPALLERVRSHPGLHPVGLMTMAPLVEDRDAVRPVFRGLRELAESLETSTGGRCRSCRWAMSNDFEAAIAEGATHVRIGRAIFGG